MASAWLVALAIGTVLMPHQSLAATVTWTGLAGDNNFNTATNWSPAAVPGSGDDVVIGSGFTVNVPSSVTINSMTTGSGTIVNDNNHLVITAGTAAGANAGTLSVSNNTSLQMSGGFNNTGAVTLNSVGNLTDLIVNGGTLSLTGSGAVTLSNNTNNRIYGASAGSVLNNVNNTISGAGEIGVNGNLSITNGAAGVFDANQTNALTFDNANTFTNNGILRATNTGGLRFTGGNIVDNTGGGRIQANGTGAHVDMQSVTFKGGTLSTSGGGVIQTTSSGSLDGSSSAVIITTGSTVQVNNNTQLNLFGTITNQGTIALGSVGNLTDLIMGAGGTVTLNGGGNVIMSDNTNNRIYGAGAGAILDNVNNTISGAGEIGVNGNFTLKNQSLIDANVTNALRIDASNPVQNTGTIRSSNTTAGNGGLLLAGTTIDNTGAGNSGLITANGANTHVDLSNSTIKGGTITTSGGGVVQTIGSTTNTLDGTSAPVTLTSGSTVLVSNNSALNLAGAINAQGAIKLGSAGNLTDLIIGGGSTTTLTGPGGITSSDNGNNRIYGGGAGAILDNVNSVIAGAGEIGVNGNLTLQNQALVDANLTNALVIDSPNAVANTGTLRSSNTTAGNAGLVLRGTIIDNTGSSNGGKILATGANTHVDITNGTTILGGTLTGTGGGVINLTNSTLDGSGVGAPVNIATGTTVNWANNTISVLNGTINNQGTFALNSIGNITDIVVGAKGLLLQGGGTIAMTDNSQNRIYSDTVGAVFENVNNIISGAGQIFPNSGMILKNDTAGVINATGSNALQINSFATPVQNLGLLETTSGTGGLVFNNSAIDNTGNSNAGKITADGAGTHVDINSSTILGGTLTGKNGGVINLNSSTLDGSGAGAPINIASGTTVNWANNTISVLNGTINNQGTFALNSIGNITDIVVGAKGLLLQGGGTIAMTDNSQNRIYSDTVGAVFENVNNTIRGAGQIFPNSGMILKNDTAGVINATGSNALQINNFATPVQNLGLLETTSGTGGLVFISSTVDNTGNSNAGKITADGAGTHVDLINSTILGGTLTGKNGGVFNGSNSVLDGTTAGAPVNIAAGTTVNYLNNTLNQLAGTINNAGTLSMNSVGNTTDLVIDAGGVTLTGGGKVVLSDNPNNRIYADAVGVVLTNVNNTIQGAGQIFANAGLSLVNGGVVDATGTNALAMTLDITNNAGGTLRGSGSGGLSIAGGTITNNGTVEALNGSSVTYNPAATNANASGGTLTGGAWRAISTGAGATLAITGGPIVTDAANMTLSGTGSVIKAYNGTSYVDIQTSLTNVASGGQLHVLNGQSYTTTNNIANAGLIDLGGGTFTTHALTNSGTVSGFGTVTQSSGSQLANTGSVIAAGGTLAVTNGLAGATGTAQSNTGATLDLSSATVASTVGTLTNNGSLNLGSHNITVSTDYTNASFGSGNSFNNHANVSGGGLILASGTGLSMTVSGTGITGGGTPTPTLALGNVHVGSPLGGAFNINWAGTGAPVLRGAVQTTSGLSVSGPSFGPITPGGSALETVSVAAGVAGALAGQSMNVVTNFDNVAGKTIAVTGAAYDLGNPIVTPSPINFGNVHVGDVVAQRAVSVQNSVITSASFQEGVNASIGTSSTGVTTNGGTITNLAAGSSNNTALKVGISTGTAGAISGTASVGLASNGATTSGLGITPLTAQNVAVTGGVYNLASSNVIAPINFGVLHVGQGGGSITQALSITNTAPTGAFSEGLNSSFGSYTAGIGDTLTPTFAGSITNLAAGSTNNASMTATISTLSAGLFNGSVGVSQASNGATTSGLGITALPGQNVGIAGSVTGGIFTFAAPTVNNAPINFGNVRVGTAVANQGISISNTAPIASTTELLNGSFVSAPAGFTGSGSFTGLAPGAAPNTSIQVGLDTSSGGAKSGNVAVNFVSDGTTIVGDGSTTNLGNTNVAVQGNVYRLANPTLNTPTVSLAARVGGASPTAAISVSNTSPDAFTENLKASIASTPAGFSNTGGAITGLAAQGTDASTMQVGLNTGTSGSFGGSAAVNFASTGAGTDGNPTDVALTSGSVALTGNVYQTAAASVTPSVNFGIVHVGDVVANKAINVANTATGALTDVVTGNVASVTGPFTNGGGTLGAGVAAGGNSNALTVGLNTGSAGVFSSGSATLALASHDAQLADVALTTSPVSLTAQVNNYAHSAFGKTSGAGSFGGGGTSYTLNLGTLTQGSTSVSAALFALNAAVGPADLLDGSYSVVSGSGFGLTGFNLFSNLAAGAQAGGLGVAFDPTALGTFSEIIDLSGIGHNASGYSASVADIFLTLNATVTGSGGGGGGGTSVPEPSSWLILLAGIGGLGAIGWARRRRAVA